MRSSLKMVLSEPGNLPAIKVRVIKNDEDELVGQVFQIFNQQFGHNSEWCSVTRDNPLPDEKTLLIRPIPDNELKNEYKRMERRLMEKGEIPIPEKPKYAEKNGDFSYEMFPSGNIVIQTKSDSIHECDAAIALVNMIRQVATMIKGVDLNSKGSEAVFQSFEDLVEDLPALLGIKSEYNATYQIPYIDGKLTVLEWLKTLPITFDWKWLAHTNELLVNYVQVTEQMLKNKMLDISSSDPAMFFLPNTESFEIKVAKNKYLFYFKKDLEKSK